MVSQVGLNFSGNSMGLNNGYGNLFGANSLQPFNSDYENDLFMPDYLKTGSLTFGANNPQIYQNTQAAQNPAGQNPVSGQTSPSIFANQSAQAQQQEPQVEVPQLAQEETSKKSNIFKTIGAAIGLSSPVVASYAAKTPVVWKSLALKVPLLGIAGFAVGSLIDGLFTKKS